MRITLEFTDDAAAKLSVAIAKAHPMRVANMTDQQVIEYGILKYCKRMEHHHRLRQTEKTVVIDDGMVRVVRA